MQFQDVSGKAISGSSIQRDSKLKKFRQFQARKFRQGIFSHLQPRQFQPVRGMSTPGKEVMAYFTESHFYLGHSTHFQIKKFLENQQQAIPGTANEENTMLGKTIPGNYRKCNIKKKIIRQFQESQLQTTLPQAIPGM